MAPLPKRTINIYSYASLQVHTLIPGQAIVINSDVPHSAVPIKNSHVMIDTIIIQTAFLSETPGNDIDRNCLSPFFHNTDLPCIPLLLENEIQNEIVKKTDSAYPPV